MPQQHTSPQPSQPPQDELSDSDLETIAAGTRSQVHGPGDDLGKSGSGSRTRPAS